MTRTLSYPAALRRAIIAPLLAALSLALVVAAALAQSGDAFGRQSPPMDPREAFALEVLPQPDGSRLLRWDVAEGYYLYREYLAAETEDGRSLTLETEPGVTKDDPTFGTVEVYFHGTEAQLGAAEGPVRVTYQGCQEDGICYPPVTDTLPAIEAAATPPAPGPASVKDPATSVASESGIILANEGGLLDGLSARGGPLLVLAGFFGFGLLLAFTPCVFPMFPILAGLLAGQDGTVGARRGALLSGTYVLAMAAAFGLLGLIAAWSGQNLQVALQSPWAVGVVAVVFVALALSMFGLYEMRLPQAWTGRLSGIGAGRGGTLGGAAALGFTSALIMGPCVTAPLAGALLYIARTGDAWLGAAALFALGLGQGVPLLIAGTFGARMLPRAGAWMEGVKAAFGVVFLGMAIWLGGRLLPGPATLALWAALLLGSGVFVGGLDRLEPGSGTAPRIRKTVGLAAILAAVLMGLGAASGAEDPMRPLAGLRPAEAAPGVADNDIAFTPVTSVPQLDAALAGSDGPSMIYVTADWCVTCKVIERRLWPDPMVREALAGTTLITADLSEFDAEGQALLDHLGSVGPPTMVFLDAEGREAPGSRLIGEPGVEEVVASARTIR
ncbi:thiol:disulfide interchange protein DsbD [Limimaricola soesokkakensis]|uniref:Thiol:disulfide interchange protein DsbD n=1 Tax=Limimaricola soesokkakensis TaxID=1343159 RepID=A0A1X7A4N0_9RHOB|nr:protein-disulfide reductase DsbD [Limimaricola soesokkakensis]PSK80847.1 thiol:disulfide interchange protein DsbD [Limimaricola soesokkakensis]SLN69952.1 Thiol:disulfide interchange protein DsbD precursor [Limimaricola soesokkakensis]